MIPTASTHDRMVTAFFDTRHEADHASADLVALGIPQSQIDIVAGRDAASTSTADTQIHEGFWASIKDMFAPEEDKHVYAEGLSRGGFLLTVHSDEANYDKIVDLLDRDGAVDLDFRENQWRSEGWSGQAGGSSAIGSSAVGPAAASTAADMRLAADTRTAAPVAQPVGSDESIALYEENLRVGKRDVNHGRVRLRSYVVSTAVNEAVQLRSERVQVNRQAVDRVLAPGEALFQDRVIEAEEHEEVPVVSKDARVVGEVSLQKTASERTEQVSDTVRKTEVEVDDQRSRHDAPGVAGGVRRFAAADAATTIVEHMDVLALDGTKVGTVDHLDAGDRIKLTRTASPDGQHHFIPLAWIDHVDQHVHLSKSAADVRTGWN